MREQRLLKRVAGVGWQVTSARRTRPRIVLDVGGMLWDEPLVGTAEAADVVGVRPQNFVRDWASCADFPAPVATLASGRVWRESDVRAFAGSRRRPRPGAERLAAIARRVAWWDDPQRTLSRPEIFIVRVLDQGSADDIVDIEAQYGRTALRRAVRRAPASLLGDRARHYWEVVLGMPHEPARPVRGVKA